MLTKSLLIEIALAVFSQQFNKETAERAVEILNRDVLFCTEEELNELSRKYNREVYSIDKMEEEEWYFGRGIDFDKEHLFYALLANICESPKCAVNKLLIANCTQHTPTKEQLDEGVINPDCWEQIKELSSFNEIPSWRDMKDRASKIAKLLCNEGYSSALIGGAPYFMSSLERELINSGITPLYAFSVRESKEEVLPDGTVRKINFFKHLGFVKAEIH